MVEQFVELDYKYFYIAKIIHYVSTNLDFSPLCVSQLESSESN